LPQIPAAALDLAEFEPGFKEWKHVHLRDDTLKRRSTQEIHDYVLEEDLWMKKRIEVVYWGVKVHV